MIPTAEHCRRVAASVRSRAETMTSRAIGKTFAVRESKTVVVRGTIVECEVAGVGAAGRSMVAQFRIVMECGSAKVRREFLVGRIPQ